MDFQTLCTSLDDGLLTVEFNRPAKKNSMTSEMMYEISKVLDDAAKNDDVSFVILTGRGDYYSSGADMSLDAFSVSIGDESSHTDSAAKKSMDRLTIGREMVASFIDFPKLLIAIVNGPAIGIAFTTLGLCDLVYASSKAFFLAPFTAHGLCAEGCSSYLFPRIMGDMKAVEVLQLGKKLSAQEAREYNLVTEIYEPVELETVILPKILHLKNHHSGESIKANKKLIRRWQYNVLHEVNKAEWEEIERRGSSPDFLKAVMKFIDNKKKQTQNKL